MRPLTRADHRGACVHVLQPNLYPKAMGNPGRKALGVGARWGETWSDAPFKQKSLTTGGSVEAATPETPGDKHRRELS